MQEIKMKELKQELIKRLCLKNNWDHPEDVNEAVEQVEWFMENLSDVLNQLQGNKTKEKEK